jgi:hypothetical protein
MLGSWGGGLDEKAQTGCVAVIRCHRKNEMDWWEHGPPRHYRDIWLLQTNSTIRAEVPHRDRTAQKGVQ